MNFAVWKKAGLIYFTLVSVAWLIIEFGCMHLFNSTFGKGSGWSGLTIILISAALLTSLCFHLRPALSVPNNTNLLASSNLVAPQQGNSSHEGIVNQISSLQGIYEVYYLSSGGSVSKSYLEIRKNKDHYTVRYKHRNFTSREEKIHLGIDNLFITLKGDNHNGLSFFVLKLPFTNNFRRLCGIISGVNNQKQPVALRVMLVRTTDSFFDVLTPERLDETKVDNEIVQFLKSDNGREVRFGDNEVLSR